MQYVSSAGSSEGVCIFCDHLATGDDEAAHILYRGNHVFVLLNAYPYNPGHLMVAPTRHVSDMSDLSSDERTELMEVTYKATEAIKEGLNPEGFNVGMNLGAAGGAGIPGHLHMHVVPRWTGDTNFMTTVGHTKVLSEMLYDTYAKLLPLF